MGIKKISLGAIVLTVAALTLSGCGIRMESKDLPTYSIAQNEKEPFGLWKFSYLNAEGKQVPMDCPAVGIFEKRHCESADGLVSFSFSVRKSRPRISSITVDGVERPVSRVTTELEGARRVWVPSDSLPKD